jgi:hypothetical protein
MLVLKAPMFCFDPVPLCSKDHSTLLHFLIVAAVMPFLLFELSVPIPRHTPWTDLAGRKKKKKNRKEHHMLQYVKRVLQYVK